jgi:hypothetical protein
VITFTSAQLDAWIAAFFYPMVRILALLAAAPPFSNAAVPIRIKLIRWHWSLRYRRFRRFRRAQEKAC